jgi:hypothetical protein
MHALLGAPSIADDDGDEHSIKEAEIAIFEHYRVHHKVSEDAHPRRLSASCAVRGVHEHHADRGTVLGHALL